jgi:hypothetical protein
MDLNLEVLLQWLSKTFDGPCRGYSQDAFRRSEVERRAIRIPESEIERIFRAYLTSSVTECIFNFRMILVQ